MNTVEKTAVDECGFVDTSVAVCPRCGRMVMEVDEADEIFFCYKDDGCKWNGKFVELRFL